jgi:hypothetical protein
VLTSNQTQKSSSNPQREFGTKHRTPAAAAGMAGRRAENVHDAAAMAGFS